MTIYDLTLAGLRTGLDQREFTAVEQSGWMAVGGRGGQ